jgi:DNA modification methylase
MDTVLDEFIRLHTTEYRPEEDRYESGSYDRGVRAGKNTPIYSAHPYHTKVPPQGIEPYIKHYTRKGDLVLDPFCGTGMTGVAALNLDRAVLLNDLSPAAQHIAKGYCTTFDLDLLKQELNRILLESQETAMFLYGTTCDCGKSAVITSTVWSDEFACKCGTRFALWDVGVDHTTGKILDTFQCPNPDCKTELRKKELSRVGSIPVVTWFLCSECKGKSHKTNEEERKLILTIEEKSIPHWFPVVPFGEDREMWRAVHRSHGIDQVCNFYTKRNLWASACLWEKIQTVNDHEVAQKLRFAFTAICQRATLMNRLRPSGAGDPLSGTLYIGSLTKEDNVFRSFAGKAMALCHIPFPNGAMSSLILLGSATNLAIPNGCVDYIFTDPPFGSNLFYADLNLLWESWLGSITDEKLEAVVHVKHKTKNTLPEYKQLMTDAFREMHRVLKPNRWVTLIFSNSDDNVWASIQEAAQEAGFVVRGGREFDKIQKSFKGTKGASGEEKVATKDVILNLHKPRIPVVQGVDLKEVDDVDGFVLKELRETLLHMSLGVPLQERTSEALARAVTRRVIEHGYSMRGMSFNYVEDVLLKRKGEFVNVEGGWYFVSARPDLQRITDEQSAIVWLTTQIAKEPKRFDELNTLWQQELNKTKYRSPDGLAVLLDTWFLKDDQGRYYPPDEYQRKQIKGLMEEQRYRDAERYRLGKLDRQPSLEEIFQWIDVYYIRQRWDMVSELGKALAVHAEWTNHEGGKNAGMKVQLASAKLSSQKETTYNDQEELF